ncbi:hypothetical protein EV426DRAFT_423320 [Tirmania nivea]|nr:hypothetical protein EV426DRAFT_423320 [Tirmania nivea]
MNSQTKRGSCTSPHVLDPTSYYRVWLALPYSFTYKRLAISTLARYTISPKTMPARRNPWAREPSLYQKCVAVLLLFLMSAMALPLLYMGVRQAVGLLLMLVVYMGSLFASPGIYIYRKLTGSNVKPTSKGIQYQSTRTSPILSLVPTVIPIPLEPVVEPPPCTDIARSPQTTAYTVTTTETPITTIFTTITTTEECSCPTPTPAATLSPTSSEISLSSGVFWSIYIPLVAVVIALVGSHIYVKSQTILLEHKRLDGKAKASQNSRFK